MSDPTPLVPATSTSLSRNRKVVVTRDPLSSHYCFTGVEDSKGINHFLSSSGKEGVGEAAYEDENRRPETNQLEQQQQQQQKTTTQEQVLGINQESQATLVEEPEEAWTSHLNKQVKISPTAAIKMSASSPFKRRSLGEGEDMADPQIPPLSTKSGASNSDANSISMDTAISSVTMEDHMGFAGRMKREALESCPTEISTSSSSSVALLRGWLDDFGKQNKSHYDKACPSGGGEAPSGVELQRPKRKLVGKRTQAPSVSKQTTNVTVPTVPSPSILTTANSSSSSIVKRKKPSASSTEKPSQQTLATPAVKAAATPSTIHSGKSSSSRDAHYRRARATPVRIIHQAKRKNEVLATNNGRAPVSKLAEWLADDPTKNKKKVQQLRRGANIIAKSRKFDKELADAIVEEQVIIATGSVAKQKDWLKYSAFHSDNDDIDGNYDEGLQGSADEGDYRHQRVRSFDTRDVESSISVTDKKKWLAGVFGDSDAQPGKAKTDIVTNRDCNEDVSKRAKQLWRSRGPSTKRSPPRKTGSTFNKSQKMPATTVTITNELSKQTLDCQEIVATVSSSSSLEIENPVEFQQDTEEIDFRAARETLVRRSKKNGNSVAVLNKVQRRKAKFERLEKEASRSCDSHGLLKTSWSSSTEEEELGRPSNSYVKKFVEDIAPKKSLDDLP